MFVFNLFNLHTAKELEIGPLSIAQSWQLATIHQEIYPLPQTGAQLPLHNINTQIVKV